MAITSDAQPKSAPGGSIRIIVRIVILTAMALVVGAWLRWWSTSVELSGSASTEGVQLQLGKTSFVDAQVRNLSGSTVTFSEVDVGAAMVRPGTAKDFCRDDAVSVVPELISRKVESNVMGHVRLAVTLDASARGCVDAIFDIPVFVQASESS